MTTSSKKDFKEVFPTILTDNLQQSMTDLVKKSWSIPVAPPIKTLPPSQWVTPFSTDKIQARLGTEGRYLKVQNLETNTYQMFCLEWDQWVEKLKLILKDQKKVDKFFKSNKQRIMTDCVQRFQRGESDLKPKEQFKKLREVFQENLKK